MYNYPLLKKKSGGSFYSYNVPYAAKFPNDGDYLVWTPSQDQDDTDKCSISFWVKLSAIETYCCPYHAYYNSSNRGGLRFYSDATLNEYLVYSATTANYVATDNIFRDTSHWYHIFYVYDTNNATDADRWRLWINGRRQTWSNVTGSLSGDLTALMRNAWAQYIGAYNNTGYSLQGYLAEFHAMDGIEANINDFGEFKYNTWVPKRATGISYGTNGFYLNFADALDLGKDMSGNGNHFTTVGNVSQTTDTPTNNFITLDSLDAFYSGNITFSEAALKQSCSSTNNDQTIGNIRLNEGKWVWEIQWISMAGGGKRVGIVDEEGTLIYYDNDGTTSNIDGSPIFDSYGSAALIRVELDLDNDTISFFKNNVLQGTGNYSFTRNGTVTPLQGNNEHSLQLINGAEGFGGTPTDGYNAICTKNIQSPNIIDPTTGYETLLYTGDGVDGRQITSLNFNPSLGSLIWTKDLDVVAGDGMFDTIRGGSHPLSMASASTEDTIDDFGLMTFLSNGFQMNEGTSATAPMGLFNTLGDEYIAYCFHKLPAYGIDIVTWDGNGSNRDIPHSLGVAPELIYVKERDGTHVWIVGYEYCTASTPWHYFGVSTAAAFAAETNVWNDTPPTSSVFTVGTNVNMNTVGKKYVAFLFTSIPGFSSFRGHIGNGSTNGPRIYTDFTPAMWMVRNCGYAASLLAFDSERNPYNYAERYWAPGLTNAETTNAAYQLDWLSNGIKIRGTGVYFNGNGNYHLNMMFAKIPFPFTNAV